MNRAAHRSSGAGDYPARGPRIERETPIQSAPPEISPRFHGPERLAHEVDLVLGRPFDEFGRGDGAGFYCLGLYLHLLERAASGVRLPDPFVDGTSAPVRAFCRHFEEMLPVSTPRPLDALFWRTAAGEAHVAMVEDKTYSVQVDRVAGVHRAPLRETHARAEALFRLKGLLA